MLSGRLSQTTVSGNGIITKFRRYDRKDSTSEAGFSDGYDNSSNNLWQTNQRIVNQPRDGDDNNAFVDLQLSQNRPTNPQTTERGSSEDEYQPISALKGKAPLLAKMPGGLLSFQCSKEDGNKSDHKCTSG